MAFKAAAELSDLKARLSAASALLAALAAASPPLPPSLADALHAASSAPTTDTPALSTLLSRPRVGVGVLLTCLGASEARGAVLVGERRASHGAGRWALPGGHLEGGEAWAVCGARELLEETGLDVDPARLRFVGVTNDIMADEHPAGPLHYITLFIACDISPEEASRVRNTEPEKCARWEWRTADQLRDVPTFTPLRNLMHADWGQAALLGHPAV